jgi:cation transport regulator ChaB
MPARKELPSTLKRSPKKAQDTWAETHDSAVETYGEGERAHRTAFSSLKHSFEKVGDHWEPKKEKGPSDKQAAKSGARARKASRGATAGGVDANASKSHLMEIAKKLDVSGRSKMSKSELVEAIQKANARSDRKARAKDAKKTAGGKKTASAKASGGKKTASAKASGGKKTTSAKASGGKKTAKKSTAKKSTAKKSTAKKSTKKSASKK